ncbi:DUF726 domain-containing protein [Photobacterium phosphoreum]|uniref:DUF726 domain-containing protein n=1 Tax=Photobacterium phosphoreum TaxID=659 RepID=UPI001E64B85A|nr:DUF726 domain-containing protein [Photobacterium phosphoreum]MCD9471325.1 hypothetical protein [Photobacterium phosphoreum]
MAKGTPSDESLQQIKDSRKFSENENKVLKFFGNTNSAFAKFDQSWNNELCAEHDGTIASFKSLTKKLNDISEYESLFVREQVNLATPAKGAAYAGIGIIGIGATLATGGGAGAVAAAIGNTGLLGAAGTGTAIVGLNGAALTTASLAAIGGSVAGGTMLITASGGSLGGVLGGVLANKFHGDDKSFAIRKLKAVTENQDKTIFINGFTQKNETDFHDWQTEHLYAGYRHSTYGVNWDSKSNARLGAAFAGGVGKPAALGMLAGIAKHGGGQAAKKLGPIGWATLITDVVSNPWHSAMLRAAQAGAQLADTISRTTGQKFNLIGHSLGCRVIFYALMALGTKSERFIDNVILLGGAVGKDDNESWTKAMKVIDGKLFNCYSKKDMVLKRLYECANAKLSKPIGYYQIPIAHKNLVNIDCTDIVDSHMHWKANFAKVLKRVN